MNAPEGFESFVAARGGALHRTAYLLTRDHGLAEDLVQTALAKAWPAWRRIQGDPEPYVRKILVNTYASWWRRKWRGEHPTADLPEAIGTAFGPAGGSAPGSAEAVGERDALVRALATLPRRQQAVIVLRFVEDLTEAQTADLLGITVGTVKSQSAKALARLRVDEHLAPPAIHPSTTRA
jgi:RNA polymerase sigma-70 factor (sigma-E family)